ncbi:hypothetical protein Bca52824_036594 [Brassica carinata]|uniref:Uncharacterized protein n=1 Tax=Brassica carinata TaxID=52824 RepID=A0A8X7V2W0_BRACI|nr:hypothetical protein Bca52824_036594 [Brassica carinata]
MAMELELDDDVFFADISKQISLLIMDEDEQLSSVSLSSSSPLSFQGMFRGGYQTAPYMYHQEQSKGTGVFIPKSSQTRRRPHHPKQGRANSFNAKQQHSLYQNRQQYQQNHDNLRSTLTTHNNKSSMMTSNVHASVPRRTYRDAASIYT